MPRYFENFFHADAMVEITQDHALSRPYYAVEDPGPPRHFRKYLRGELARVVYPVFDDAVVPTHVVRYPGLGFETFSPLVKTDCARWTHWFHGPDGARQRGVAYEMDDGGHITSEAFLDHGGAVVSRNIHVRDAEGNLVEIHHLDPAGVLLSTEEIE